MYLIKKIMLISLSSILLGGCQSIGDHLNCRTEVDRTVPPQTEQRYLRTDTKCVRSSQQSLGGGMGTINNPSMGDVNCSSVPIYETIVLNQAQRDAAYQRCRNKTTSVNRATTNSSQSYSNSSQSYSNSSAPIGKSVYNLKDAEIACTSATVKASPAYNKCIEELLKTSQNQPSNTPLQSLQPFSDAEWKSKVDKNKQVQAELLRKKRAAEDICLGMGLNINSQGFSKCVYKETSK